MLSLYALSHFRCEIEFLHRIGAQRFKHVITLVAPRRISDDERLVGQRAQHVEHIHAIHAVVSTDALGGVQPEPSGKDRQPAEDALFLRRQELIAPADEAGKSSLARLCGAASAA